jgi:hypothetical protein
LDRLADDDEDAGADDPADAQRGEVQRTDGAAQPGLVAGLGDQRVGRLAGQQPGTRGGGHSVELPESCAGQTGILCAPAPCRHGARHLFRPSRPLPSQG